MRYPADRELFDQDFAVGQVVASRGRRLLAPQAMVGQAMAVLAMVAISLLMSLSISAPVAAQALPNNFPSRVSGQAQPYPGGPSQFPGGAPRPRLASPAQPPMTPQPAATAPSAVPPASAPAADATNPPSTNLPPSVLQQPAHRAVVRVGADGLYIKAENSNLSQILHDIASATGTKVSGQAGEERIFGTYGPGDADQVLTALLYGSDYNLLMVGSLAAGTPRELVLTRRSNALPGSNSPPPPTRSDDDADAGTPYEDQDAPQQPPGFGRGEGRTSVPPPPNAIPSGSPDDTVRTPQQLLEQLQQLHRQNDGTQPVPAPQQ